VSKSGYYDWRERQPSARAIEDVELKQKIQQIFTENKGRYGSPRIFKTLQKQGYNIGKKRVERLYNALGLVARVMRVTTRSAFYKRFLTTGTNLRPDGAVPLAKDKVWVADVTYLKVKGVWRYLSVIMDLYSRRIISWSLDKNRTMDVTKRTLENAVKKRKPSGDLMLHTDRGVEYRGQVYQKVLKRHGIIHSLSRAGKCTDNAHMESFFHSMKTEVIRGNVFQSDKELRGTLGSYINKYYNVSRMHSGISYCSPIEYEALAA
jgi:putative transposase